MQQKRAHNTKIIVLGGIGFALILMLGGLIMTDLPAPTTTIEKELDAQTFLAPKQPQ